ncbi:hypothetical protein K488DRAFT_75300 [Vararia minispora EC-137]|uniref:Uncharacterized protein n=1 Tax=Vararia minispora EC-137 TaxID=1314806 RepID=A0ACB8Q438_9AGAM|nr:hypothetical protein K488DRAFT_75300 [Vararia minispora EC-137]
MAPQIQIQLYHRTPTSAARLRIATPYILLAFFFCFFATVCFLVFGFVAARRYWRHRRSIRQKIAPKSVSPTPSSSPSGRHGTEPNTQTFWSLLARSTLVATGVVRLGVMHTPRSVSSSPSSRSRSPRAIFRTIARFFQSLETNRSATSPILPTSVMGNDDMAYDDLKLPSIVITPPLDDGMFSYPALQEKPRLPSTFFRSAHSKVDLAYLAPNAGMYDSTRIRTTQTLGATIQRTTADSGREDTLGSMDGMEAEIRSDTTGGVKNA